MKVKDLLELLKGADPESTVLVRVDGSIFPTDTLDEHEDYNFGSEAEVFILTSEEWE